MRKTVITLSVFAFVGALMFQSCKKETTDTEFVADNSTFSNFMSFALRDTKHGANPALGGMAHGGNDSTVTRAIHFKNDQNRSGGKFPVGTVIVKHATSPGGMNEITAMVKRGHNFNPSVGDWEFFMLMPNGNIATDTSGMQMRGANLMGGMCGSCHGAASSQDFIFTN
jgi:hypothetical protein